MSGPETFPAAPTADRAAWLRSLRQVSERQEDALSPVFDAQRGEIEDTHRALVGRFLSMLPPGGRVLDAACGTGKYFPMVLAGGRSLLGVDHSAGLLAQALARFADVPVDKRDLQDLPYREEFDGVMCVDAMEMVPPEDWPGVLDGFRRALRPGGWLYLTVELAPEDRVGARNEEARRSGLPVVEGEVIWDDEPEGYYHHHPTMGRVRAWVADAGFAIVEDVEGPWHAADHAYHHLLSRAEAEEVHVVREVESA
ncbi:MAG: class I SAM-dependent methyltransferase [Actinomycetota bacterium]